MVAGSSPGGGSALSRLIAGDAIRIRAHAEDWRSAVRVAGEALVAGGATDPAYTDEMIATVEQLGPYIVIAPGIALAHARPSAAVHRPGISIVTLDAPVEFGHRQNDPVHLVVGLASPDAEGHITALATLAEFLSADDRRTSLMAAQEAEEVRRMIEEYEGGSAT
jgi:ascorbate PTS system EIIA or EIIAB component